MQKRTTLIHLSLITVLIGCLYAPVINHEFITWDDTRFLLQDPNIRAWSWPALKQIWTPIAGQTFIPLTSTFFQIENVLTDLNPRWTHGINLLLHLVNASLVYWLIFLWSKSRRAALIAAIFFGIHTLNVEVVAWATGRKDLLMTLFALSSLITWHHHQSARKKVTYFLSILFYLLAITAKPTAAPLAFFLFLFAPTKKSTLPFIVISLIFGSIAIFYTHGFEWFRQDSFMDRILVAIKGLAFYLDKILLPLRLSPMYPYPQAPSITNPDFFIPILTVTTLGALLWHWRHKKPLVFGAMFFLILVAPTLWKASPDSFFTADRFAYLPSVGLIYLAALAIDRIWKPWIVILMVLAMTSLSLLTAARQRVWRDSETLYRDALTHHPGAWLLRNNLGIIYSKKGLMNEAMQEFETVLATRPDHRKARFNLILANLKLNRPEEAMRHYQLLAQLPGYDADISRDLGFFCLQFGLYGDAMEHFDRALRKNPNDPEIYMEMGRIYERLGIASSAKRMYEKAKLYQP